MTMPRTVFRTCTLCEAMCGLKLELDGDRIVSVRGDEDDPFSQGYICPKGVAIGEVHHDPDRLRTPLGRVSDGSFAPIGWDEAFGLVEQRLHAVRARGGADAIAVYMGNPIIHNYGVLLLRAGFARAVGRVYRGPVPIHVTDEMMQGVVSLPHGWGHRDVGRWQKVAGSRAGVSVNDWTDDGDVEVVVGQSILNGIPVQLKPAISAVAGE